jgi:hypothetical protein
VTYSWECISPLFHNTIPACGEFFIVDELRHAGLSSSAKVRRLFTTSEVSRLHEDLNSLVQSTQRALIIEGSPGLGKSCTAWAWACNQGLFYGKQVLWIHLVKFRYSSCIWFANKSCKTSQLTPEALVELLKKSRADILICDGYDSKIGGRFDACIAEMMNFAERNRIKVIFVSSLGGFLRPADFQLETSEVRRFEFRPWTMQDYEAAISDTEFRKSVRQFFEGTADEISAEILQGKHFVAGCSVRWMFTMDIETIKTEINWYISAVVDIKALMNLSASTAIAESSNHLLMRTKHDDGFCTQFFVSKYAMQQAMLKFGEEGIAWSYHLSVRTRNRSHFGWVLEFDFHGKLFAAVTGLQQVVVQDQSNTLIPWRVSHAERFDGNSEISAPWEFDNWKIPFSNRQAGFDAACLVQIGAINILRVVQVTCAAKHSLRMDAFADLIGKLVKTGLIVSGLEVIFLLPKYMDKEKIAPPVLELSGAGRCLPFKVGGSEANWAVGQEDKHVLFYGLQVPVNFFTER